MSLSAPLSGHGVTGTDRFALTCMCLAVGTVLIRVLALTVRPSRQPADDAAARPGGQAAVAGQASRRFCPGRGRPVSPSLQRRAAPGTVAGSTSTSRDADRAGPSCHAASSRLGCLPRSTRRSPDRRGLSTASISAIRTHIFPVPARELSPAVSMAAGLHWADHGCSSGRCGAHRQIRDGPARP